MGTFSAEVGVNNGNGGPTQHVEAVADTGTGFSIFPDAFLRERVGIRPKRYDTFVFADGREREMPVGEARFIIGDRDAVSPVVFGTGDYFLLGAVTLQALSLIADTTNHKLIPARKFARPL